MDSLKEFLGPQIVDHLTHTWVKRGHHVFCEPCNCKLYKGELPEKQEKKPLPEVNHAAVALMRKNWSKD